MNTPEFKALFWLCLSVKHPSLLMRAHALDQACYWGGIASMIAKGELCPI